MKSILILVIALFKPPLQAQNCFWNSSQAYLGQSAPSDTPKIFAEKMLLPDSGIALDRSAFSADGKEFYYCTAQHWFNANGAKVRYFKYDGEKWLGPIVLNEGFYAPTFCMDGKTLYFLGGKGDGLHGYVWASERVENGWSSPVLYLKKEYGLYDFMPTLSGTCYVGSNANQGSRKDFITYDFCTLKLGKKDTVIKSLGLPLNTSGFDGDFFIAPDESCIIVSNHETKTYKSELAISFRKPDHSWSVPVGLGPLINQGLADRWGQYVTPNGKYLFYSKGNSEKDCHIYWVRFDTLKQRLRRQAFN